MIIIAEGSDLAGKTTLLHQLMKDLPRAYLFKYNTRPADDSFKERKRILDLYWEMWRGLMAAQHSNEKTILLLDRYYVSEAVYGPIMRNYDPIEDPDYAALHKMILSDPYIMYLFIIEPDEVLEERYKGRGDEHVNLDQVKQVSHGYTRFMTKLITNPDFKAQVTVYAPSRGNVSELRDIILQNLNNIQQLNRRKDEWLKKPPLN